MHVEAGDKLPIASFFSVDWEPAVIADTPTLIIERRNMITSVWDKPVDSQSVTVLASGLCYYDYTTEIGFYQYEITMTTTDSRVDQNTIILETMLSGGWPNKVLGLLQQNFYIDNTAYDSDGNLTSARVRIYSDAASVGTSSGVLDTFTLTAVFSDAGRITTYKMVKS